MVAASSLAFAPRPRFLRLAVAYFGVYIVWGTTYLAIRLSLDSIPPLLTMGIRHVIAGIILLVPHWLTASAPSLRKLTM